MSLLHIAQVIRGILCHGVLPFDSKIDTFPVNRAEKKTVAFLNTDAFVMGQCHAYTNYFLNVTPVCMLCK